MKKKLLLLALLACLMAIFPYWGTSGKAQALADGGTAKSAKSQTLAAASNSQSTDEQETSTLPSVVDDANLLSVEEKTTLENTLDNLREKHAFDIVVVTANTLQGKSPMAYADDFFDYQGYGVGTNRDGILLLVSMEDRDWWISTSGYGITAFTDAGMDYMKDEFLPYLSDGDYSGAFQSFAELCDEFLTEAREGKPFDRGHMPYRPLGIMSIGISFLAGLVIAFIIAGTMRGKLKTVHNKTAATDYLKSGSFRLHDSRDIFLYSNIRRVARPKQNSSGGGGGSRTHTSSSGRSHGGSGGKF